MASQQLRLKDLPYRDWLQSMYVLQKELQQTINEGRDVDDFSVEEHIDNLRSNAFALMAELFEAFGEVGWKPWATKRFINDEAFKAEMVDMFKFFMNMMLHVGMTPKELLTGFMRKHAINYERVVNGYDGVSTKCPVCKREYSDTGVECSPGVHVNKTTTQTELILNAEPVRVPRRNRDARRPLRADDARKPGESVRLGGRSRSRHK